MRVLKRSARRAPEVSFILLDWSVRESFHLLHYLASQTIDRSRFEVVVIEYYSRESPALRPFLQEVDTWALLDMPGDRYYHKHLMYNAGIVLAGGDILAFCDSDAMARPTLVASIVQAFEARAPLVLHLDQFRNVRRSFYPFNYPSFEAVLGPGCINNVNGRTRGLATFDDPLHDRNYGACMCARRDDLIAIGGADEHIDYLGHICGPYEMTFRLVNHGCREEWHPTEFLYHTWHPGQAGADNYLGPHDGRHMSTTALEALVTQRTHPYVMNPALAALAHPNGLSVEEIERLVAAPERAAAWRVNGSLPAGARQTASQTGGLFDYRGFRVRQEGARQVASLIVEERLPPGQRSLVLTARSREAMRAQINRAISPVAKVAMASGSGLLLALRGAAAGREMARRAGHRLAALPGAVAGAARGALRRMGDRWRRFFMERRHLSGGLASVIVNLTFMKQRAHLAGEGACVLVVGSRPLARYVQALSALGVLPRIRVVTLRGDQVSAWAAHFGRNGNRERLFVARAFYVQHYTRFAEAGLVSRTTVL
jgi:hypothetical protein